MSGADFIHDEEYEAMVIELRARIADLEQQLAEANERNSRLWEMLHWWQKAHPNSRVQFIDTSHHSVVCRDGGRESESLGAEPVGDP